MIRLALKKIAENRRMTLLTIIGIAFSIVIMLVSIYRIHVTNIIDREQFKKSAQNRRIQYNKMDLFPEKYCVDEYGNSEWGEFEFSSDVLAALKAMKGVEGLKALYLDLSEDFNQRHSVSFSGILYDRVRLDGIDPEYDTFDRSLIELYEDRSPIISGRCFQNGDRASCMVGELFLLGTPYTAQDIIGKTVELSGYDRPITIIGVYSTDFSEQFAGNDVESIKKHIAEYGLNKRYGDILFSMDIIKEVSKDRIAPNRVSLTLFDFKDTKKIYEKIDKIYGVFMNSDYFVYYLRVLETTAYSRLLLFFGAVTLVICMLLLSITVAINISNQQETIKLLKILGEKEYKLVLMVVEETLILSGAGIVIGAFLGYIFSTSIAMGYGGTLKGIIDTKMLIMPIEYILLLCLIVFGVSLMIGTCFGLCGVKKKTEGIVYEE